MTTELPKFPESLPPPVEMTEGPRRVFLTPEELPNTEKISELVHDLYWFSDDLYFLFYPHGKGIGLDLNKRMESNGVGMRKTELYFYRRLKPAYENDFIRVLPHSAEYDWQRETEKGQMFGRVTLSLEPWRRKQLDLEYAAHVTSGAIVNNEPVVEMKPNYCGMGINVRALLKKLKRWWRDRKESN